jgi:DNA-binding NtrC family response regulator
MKPVNLGKLEAVIQRGLEHQRLVLEQHELRRRIDEQYGLGNLIGNSRQMVKLYNAVRKAAPHNAPVLIQGESGTGKDLIALALHYNSPRRDEPFVKVQCGGVPDSRLDVELFGCVAGAVPGMATARQGRIEAADKGALFIDDIDELAPAQQNGLMEVIARHRVQRIGATRTTPVDVRIMGSTTGPLAPATFREDLYNVLRSTTIEAPPLRDRREDIPLLVHCFLREASRAGGVPVAGITRNGLDLLMRYDWPGNVRELRNIVEGMAVLGRGLRPLDVGDIPPHIRRDAESVASEMRIPVGTSMRDVERTVIEETLRACGYHKPACAAALGIGLRTLYRKLKEYEIP